MAVRRWDVLNYLIEGFGYASYLEIGVAGGASFNRVRVASKLGVDPAIRLWSLLRRNVIKTTSDTFFKRNRRTFDLVFVDGMHEAGQALSDIRNSLRVLSPSGTIVVHDCLPNSRRQQMVPRIQSSWTGDVWRAFLAVSADPDLHTFVLECETGCGVVRPVGGPRQNSSMQLPPDPMKGEIPWEVFDKNKSAWLRIIPEGEIFKVLDVMFHERDSG